jgi:hypothetical protein
MSASDLPSYKKRRYSRTIVALCIAIFASTISVGDAQTAFELEALEGECTNAGESVGPSGNQIIDSPEPFEGEDFVRKNGDGCKCSFAETECKVNGITDCSMYEVDGVAAATDGYPEVTVEYSMKMCNYNDEDMDLSSNPKKHVHTEFFHPETGSDPTKQIFLAQKTFNGETLTVGECKGTTGTVKLSTSRAKYFMESSLRGRLSQSDEFCYAYAFNKIDFKYNYSPEVPTCDVYTRLSCVLNDGSGTSCEEHIQKNVATCEDTFSANFIAEACNKGRDIKIQTGSSKYKINTYTLKDNGSLKRNETSLNEELKGPTNGGDEHCQTFLTTKVVDPCKPNFWQVNIQGKFFIKNETYPYKDKDCQSFSFDKLPVYEINGQNNAPTSLPTPAPATAPPTPRPAPDPATAPTTPRPTPDPATAPTTPRPTPIPIAPPTPGPDSNPPPQTPDEPSAPSCDPTSQPSSKRKGKGKGRGPKRSWEYNCGEPRGLRATPKDGKRMN